MSTTGLRDITCQRCGRSDVVTHAFAYGRVTVCGPCASGPGNDPFAPHPWIAAQARRSAPVVPRQYTVELSGRARKGARYQVFIYTVDAVDEGTAIEHAKGKYAAAYPKGSVPVVQSCSGPSVGEEKGGNDGRHDHGRDTDHP